MLLVAGLALVAADDEVKTEDSVLVLTKDNFQKVIEENEFVLVEFYAPWCGHCKALAPEYAKAAQALEEKKSPIKLGKIDATEEQELAEKNGIRGYPTLKFYRSGTPIEYTGGREKDTIISWLEKKTGPAAKELETVEAAEEFLKENKVVVVGFFKDRESAEAKAFLSAANAIDEYPFAITSSDDVYATANELEHTKINSFPTIFLYRKGDNQKVEFRGERTLEGFIAFLDGKEATEDSEVKEDVEEEDKPGKDEL